MTFCDILGSSSTYEKKAFKIRSLKKHQLIGLIVSQTGNMQNVSKIEISIRTLPIDSPLVAINVTHTDTYK